MRLIVTHAETGGTLLTAYFEGGRLQAENHLDLPYSDEVAAIVNAVVWTKMIFPQHDRRACLEDIGRRLAERLEPLAWRIEP